MSSSASGELTRLLASARAEGPDASDAASEVFGRLNDELRSTARRLLDAEPQGTTLQPTVLVNEAWLKMQGDGRLNLPAGTNRGQFLCLAAVIMREILVDYARRRLAAKRGGGQVKVSLDGCDLAEAPEDPEVLALHEALERLAGLLPRAARVVELRYFGGATIPETAAALNVSSATVKKDWRFARAWLRRELRDHA
jgi:RNA polymerase sigma factor (TIGR02999 family)